MMAEEPRVLFTIGDPSGIGPEVVLKALLPLRLGGHFSTGVVGPAAMWEVASRDLGVLPPEMNEAMVIEPEGYGSMTEDEARELLFSGEPTAEAASVAIASLRTACDMVAADPEGSALVTAPINKHAFHEAGETAPGHTEWLGERLGAEIPVMLMVGADLRVALGTTHVPVRDVADELDRDGLVKRLHVLADGLRLRFGIEEPNIAMLALNPHGGADAEADIEEEQILRPALEQARADGLSVDGLFAADGFFGRKRWQHYDAVLAAYHDQGLVPLKMHAAGAGVNVTLGLPIVRTSPDHGTAFDIAGRGIASESSMIAAAQLADALLSGRGGG
jgi:4-hydroxythreonine-4-phosphate dehydrogenase